VRGVVIDSMGLPADQQIDVEASGLLLPQVVAGRLDELRLSSEDVAIGGLSGAVRVDATGVPLRGGEIASANGTVTLDREQFAALVDKAGLPIEKVELDAPDVTVAGSIPVFGMSVPLALRVTPGADAGELLLTPVSVSIAGADVDLGDLAGRLGPLGSGLAQTQRICIADRLPAGITLTGLKVAGDRVIADVAVDGRIAVDGDLLQNGTC
ncbi:MAG: LmeA family phospholipid-binding protein, partial [Microbacterium sp.]